MVAMAILTISDTRGPDDDRSGQTLVSRAQAAGHQVVERDWCVDDRYQVRCRIAQWCCDPRIQVILTTGGTGYSGRDVTPQAVIPIIDQSIPGFGELFRQMSLAQIGSSTVQSRALAGFSSGKLLFCLPGSTGACELGWDQIIAEQLDADFRPCNFVGRLPKKPNN